MQQVVEALSLSSLVAGTLEYAIMIRHREDRRRAASDRAESEVLGHEALARAHLLDVSRPIRHWSGAATRFR
ncbi:MAG: hypothetical protein ACRDHD_04395 [Candidatus Limnocylindria bacterium]